jgi:hypothetical protein
MYEEVLLNAKHDDDLCIWLDGPTLVDLWPALMLPVQLKVLWEDRFITIGRRFGPPAEWR